LDAVLSIHVSARPKSGINVHGHQSRVENHLPIESLLQAIPSTSSRQSSGTLPVRILQLRRAGDHQTGRRSCFLNRSSDEAYLMQPRDSVASRNKCRQALDQL
jgi:hypothetical protein